MAGILRLRAGRSSKPDGNAPNPRRTSRTGALIRVGMVLLLCGMIGFAIYQVARHVTVGLTTLRTQEIVDEAYVELDLYIFRDETVLTATGADLIQYSVRDGERVGVGGALGTIFGGSTLSSEELKALQARLNACVDRMALAKELGGYGTPGEAREEAEAVDRNYLGLLDAAGRGDLSAVNGFADEMLNGMGRYDMLTGGIDTSSTLAALEAEAASILAGLSPQAVARTDRGGYFYYDVDGYESAFPYAEAMTMTPEAFRTMTTASAAGVPTSTVGKLVRNPVWYAATYIPIDPDASDEEKDIAVEIFQQGVLSNRTYRVRCADSAGTEINLTIERFVPDETGVLLVFSSQDMPSGFAFSRKLRVETVARTATGYRIPDEALVTLRSEKTGESVNGVYILAGGVVEFRKVHIQVQRDGYAIAATYEEMQALLDGMTDEEYAAATADGWSYLRLNDNIITGGNELYEGKMIS